MQRVPHKILVLVRMRAKGKFRCDSLGFQKNDR